MAQGGEFAFVLYAAAVAVGLMTQEKRGSECHRHRLDGADATDGDPA
jgi:hypothetical protein